MNSEPLSPSEAPSREDLEQALREARLKIERLQLERDSLKLRLAEALQRLFGRRSEKLAPGQGEFPFMEELAAEACKEIEAQEAADTAQEAEAQEEQEPPRKKKKHWGRNPLPKDLPVREEIIELSPQERICPCGCGQLRVKISEKVTDELEYEPARCFLRRIRRFIYACPVHKEHVASAPLPPRPIDRGRPGPGLLAHVAVSKYADHLPLYRLETIFERSGIELPRTTLCSWLGEVAGLLEPIVVAQKKWMLSQSLLQADETPVRVMDRTHPGKTRTGFLWVYAIPWAEVVFDFQLPRARAGPSNFLRGFRGYLQTDGYRGYDEIVRMEHIVRLACWAHGRRGFYKAKAYHPRRCTIILALIQKLYVIERTAKNERLEGEARVELRRREALPILEALHLAIKEARAEVLPQSLLGNACGYALSRWTELTRYVEIPQAEIDNNSVENGLRGVALGRKNWMFLGHPQGGGLRAEVFYSLIGTCLRLGINPHEYLRDVIERISTHPASRVLELVPRFWLAERQKAEAATQASIG